MKAIKQKHQPLGFQIFYEDLDVIVGCKKAGFLTVAALWEKQKTVHEALNQYIRKGNPRSNKCVYVVHRLDQATTGVLIFAKTEKVQHYLKDNWKSTIKNYYTIVHGHLKKKTGLIESYLKEDEDYVIHSSQNKEAGKLAQTQYEVLHETQNMSLVKINLLTGRKNQIRVHMADLGHPVIGDEKYGKKDNFKNLMLHSFSIEFTHPFKKDRRFFSADVPDYFKKLIPYDYLKETSKKPPSEKPS